MATEQSSQETGPFPRSAERPFPPSRRVVASVVVWFLGWPVVFFACLPLVTPGDTLQVCLVGAGNLLWIVSCYGIYGLLLAMAEARWPAAKTILKILGGVVVSIIRSLK